MSLMKKVHEKIIGLGRKRERRFLRNTSMDVLKYVISDSNLPWWTKLYFTIIFALVVLVAVNLAVGIYNKWDSTPVIIGISSTMTPINQIPFPAITVCNMNQAKKSKVQHLKPGSLGYA
ncbi:hypothetical protein M5D96_006038, partial [Drosophila gunungcola]